MMRQRQTVHGGLLAVLLLGGPLSGCSTLGLGNSQYSCDGYPDGDFCRSVREVYEGDSAELAEEHAREVRTAREHRAGTMEARVPRPIRTPARVMRVWHAPMEDQRGVLHMATYSFIEVEARRWSVGEPRIRDGDGARLMRLSPEDVPDTQAPEDAPGTEAPEPQETGAQAGGSGRTSDVQQRVEQELSRSRAE